MSTADVDAHGCKALIFPSRPSMCTLDPLCTFSSFWGASSSSSHLSPPPSRFPPDDSHAQTSVLLCPLSLQVLHTVPLPSSYCPVPS